MDRRAVRTTPVTVEYTGRDGKRVQRTLPMLAARSFYASQLRAGKSPRVVGASQEKAGSVPVGSFSVSPKGSAMTSSETPTPSAAAKTSKPKAKKPAKKAATSRTAEAFNTAAMGVLKAVKTNRKTRTEIKEAGVEYSNFTKLIGDMEGLGLVKEVKHPDDKHRYVEITAKGRDWKPSK